MVARPQMREGAAGAPADPGPVGGLVLAWRRLVSAAVRAFGRLWTGIGGSRVVASAGLAVRYVRDPAGTLRTADTSDLARLKEAGAAALALGVALSFAVPSAFGGSMLQRFLAAGWTAGWAPVRLLVLRIALGRERAGRAEDAWGPALLPYALAVADPLGLVALAVSAWLTLTGLLARDVPRTDARAAVAWAFGGQLAAEAAAWIGRGTIVFLLASVAGR
jgi:hypothetical protein